MRWTPALGTARLERRLGRQEALATLVALLSGDVAGPDLLEPDWAQALLDVGGGHAARLMDDPTGARFAYWPRSWAARATAHLGAPGAAGALLAALDDEHWRVRMTAVQSLGRLGIAGHGDRLIEMLDDAHPRVRSAAVVALGRVGAGEALPALAARRDTLGAGRVDRALDAISRRS